jgi:hypothetical protein
MLVAATFGKIVVRCGGTALAACHWTCPRYDPPCIPTLPLDQGCAAAHSIVSYPSSMLSR